ncbi:MAG: hypothetical protein Kow0025_14840 [Thermodesulfovibrionales bacterium]
MLLLWSAPGRGQAGILSTLVIDPGHGGYDGGISAPGVKEKDLVLAVARRMEEILRKERKEVFLTRRVDQHLSVSERLARANERVPDLFLSLHVSDSDAFAVYVTWYTDKDAELTLRRYYSIGSRQRRYLFESKALSTVLAETLEKEFGRRVFQREMPMPVLNTIGAPAVMVEIPSREIEYDEKTRERMAYALAIAIMLYEQRQ